MLIDPAADSRYLQVGGNCLMHVDQIVSATQFLNEVTKIQCAIEQTHGKSSGFQAFSPCYSHRFREETNIYVHVHTY
ncbi:hypothetical protein SMATCC274_29710 [Serratia marcescens]|nr:hypothetical protein SMATCC274_29710 [Serratia marcescens]